MWDPVLTELREHPGRPACVNLRTVLTTPLMVGLARAIYSDAAGRDPAELLDTDRFGSQYALEDHLLGSFIPTRLPRPARRRAGIPSGSGAGWATLPGTSTGSAPRDLAWWQLGSAMRRCVAPCWSSGWCAGLAVGLRQRLLMWLRWARRTGRTATRS